MDYKNNQKNQFISNVVKNKYFYPIAGLVILLIIVLGFLFVHWQSQLAAKRVAAEQTKKATQVLEDKKKNATYSRLSFFLSAPSGEKGAFNVPSYLEGYWRLSDTSATDKKMTIMYVKNPDLVAPLMYIRYDSKTDFKLSAGEIELKTDSKKYSYAYYFYPVSSYKGADKADYSSMQNDFTDSLKTFGIF
jgi:hypothetical protein